MNRITYHLIYKHIPFMYYMICWYDGVVSTGLIVQTGFRLL